MRLKIRYICQEQRDFAAMANKVDGVVCPFCVWIYVFNCKSLKCYFTQFSQRQGYFEIDSTLTN